MLDDRLIVRTAIDFNAHNITVNMSWSVRSEGPTATLSHRMFTSEQYRALQTGG